MNNKNQEIESTPEISKIKAHKPKPKSYKEDKNSAKQIFVKSKNSKKDNHNDETDENKRKSTTGGIPDEYDSDSLYSKMSEKNIHRKTNVKIF